MEDVNCLLCGHNERRCRFEGSDRLYGGPGSFSLVECVRCGFLYLSPRPSPEEIHQYYPTRYASYQPAVYEERSLVRCVDRIVGLRQRCDAVVRHKRSGRLLDVGCGTGDFLAMMRGHPDWHVRGLEPVEAAATRAQAKYGLAVDLTPLESMSYPSESFDAITLWDVLEHLPEPVASLQRLAGALRPGGVVVVAVPSRDSLDARIFGSDWAGLDIPRHFSVFSERHLTAAFNQAGLDCLESFNLTGSFHSFALSTHIWASRQGTRSRRARLLVRMVDSLPVRIATLPYFQAIRALRLGGTLTAVGRKPVT